MPLNNQGGGWQTDGETFAKLAAQLLKHFPNPAR